METTTEGALDARLERQEQIKQFRKLREGIESGILASKRALKGDDLEAAFEKLNEPAQKVEELKEIFDADNAIQARSYSRVAEELQRQQLHVETAKIKKEKKGKSGSRSRAKSGGIPVEELQWLLNALYLIGRDHHDLFSELHIGKCAKWAKKFEKQGYAEERPLLTINNYIRKYKQKYLFDKADVMSRLTASQPASETPSPTKPDAAKSQATAEAKPAAKKSQATTEEE